MGDDRDIDLQASDGVLIPSESRQYYDSVSSKFEARKLRMSHTKEGHILQLVINPVDTPEDILRDLIGQRYLIVAVRIGDNEEPEQTPNSLEGQQAVQIAGLLSRDTAFQNWLCLTGRAGDMSEEAAAEYIRSHCGIVSRSDLKNNNVARAKFWDLKEEFEAYISTKSWR